MLRIIRVQVIQSRLFASSVKVRFAPSPTGHLHLGGLRTALYNYLFARANGGSFIIRIEDTDRSRVVAGAVETMYNDLLWAGIIPDEDPIRGGPNGPYVQSKRQEIYREHAQRLLDNGTAYCCFCSEQRLDLLRKEAMRARQVPRYDNRCRDLTPAETSDRIRQGKNHCIRFKLTPTPEPFEDLIYGQVTQNLALREGDPVIMKSDGFPTYHFACVVDDHLMEISHVLRGIEWQVSTPKHLLMYKAFGWEPPLFGHLPLLLNPDGTKLSKRRADVTVESYRKLGIFPLALLNYVILAGGGFRSEDHTAYIDSYEQLIKQFDLSRIKCSSGKLAPQRLMDYNRQEIAKLISNSQNKRFLVERVQQLVSEALPDRKVGDGIQLDEGHILAVLNWAQNRVETLNDLVKPDLLYLWTVPRNISNDFTPELTEAVKMFGASLAEEAIADWSLAEVNNFLKDFATRSGIDYITFMKTMRFVLSGHQQGAPVAEIVSVLGKDVTLQRINRCFLQQSASGLAN